MIGYRVILIYHESLFLRAWSPETHGEINTHPPMPLGMPSVSRCADNLNKHLNSSILKRNRVIPVKWRVWEQHQDKTLLPGG